MVNDCEVSESNIHGTDYCSPLEISERDDVSKKTVVDRCNAGKYPGAIKTAPDRTNRQGLWLIPQGSIYTPDNRFQPTTIQTNAATLKSEFVEVVNQTIAPLVQKLDEQTEIIKQLQVANENSTQTITTKLEETNKAVGELSRSARHSDQNSDLSWWRIVLVTIFVIGIIFAFSVIFTRYLQ